MREPRGESLHHGIVFLHEHADTPNAFALLRTRRVRRIGVLYPADKNDPLVESRFSAFTQALANLGWTDGRNVRMDVRWYGDDINRSRALAHELVGNPTSS